MWNGRVFLLYFRQQVCGRFPERMFRMELLIHHRVKGLGMKFCRHEEFSGGTDSCNERRGHIENLLICGKIIALYLKSHLSISQNYLVNISNSSSVVYHLKLD